MHPFIPTEWRLKNGNTKVGNDRKQNVKCKKNGISFVYRDERFLLLNMT